MLLNFTAPRNGEKIIRIDWCEQWLTCFWFKCLAGIKNYSQLCDKVAHIY